MRKKEQELYDWKMENLVLITENDRARLEFVKEFLTQWLGIRDFDNITIGVKPIPARIFMYALYAILVKYENSCGKEEQ